MTKRGMAEVGGPNVAAKKGPAFVKQEPKSWQASQVSMGGPGSGPHGHGAAPGLVPPHAREKSEAAKLATMKAEQQGSIQGHRDAASAHSRAASAINPSGQLSTSTAASRYHSEMAQHHDRAARGTRLAERGGPNVAALALGGPGSGRHPGDTASHDANIFSRRAYMTNDPAHHKTAMEAHLTAAHGHRAIMQKQQAQGKSGAYHQMKVEQHLATARYHATSIKHALEGKQMAEQRAWDEASGVR